MLVRLRGLNTISCLHLSDFGTAKRMPEKYEPLRGKMGTLEYMAPQVKAEQPFDPFAADGKKNSFSLLSFCDTQTLTGSQFGRWE